MTSVQILIAIIGIGIIIDGAGSIALQRKQAFFWWHFERIIRILAGIALVILSLQ